MDERANGSWPFHGVGEPDLQRKLSRLPHAAQEDAETGHHQQPIGHVAETLFPNRIGCLDRPSQFRRIKMVGKEYGLFTVRVGLERQAVVFWFLLRRGTN